MSYLVLEKIFQEVLEEFFNNNFNDNGNKINYGVNQIPTVKVGKTK